MHARIEARPGVAILNPLRQADRGDDDSVREQKIRRQNIWVSSHRHNDMGRLPLAVKEQALCKTHADCVETRVDGILLTPVWR
jgi:hypothetical protein